MTTQDGTYQRLTVAEAAADLGVSRMTVRRMIQRGQLEAERVHPATGQRVHGHPARRRHRPGHTHGTGATAQSTSQRHRAGHTYGAAAEIVGHNLSPAEQLAAWSETFLVPLVAALERQVERVTKLERETAGRLSNSSLPPRRSVRSGPRFRCWRPQEHRRPSRRLPSHRSGPHGRVDGQVTRYEEDAYYPRLPTFAALARVLGVSMDVLWYGEEEAEWLAWRREQD